MLIFGVSFAWSQSIGVITGLRGNVTLQRNGETISSNDLDIGMEVENLDFVRTARGSTIEFTLDPASGIGGKLIVAENSACQIEISKMRTGRRGNIELLAGSVALSVNRLTGGSGLDVRTQSASMGVRGTEFKVETGPAGEVLVSTSEGKVACTDPEGNIVNSEPGTVVEAPGEEGGRLRAIPVSISTLEQFRREWTAEKVSAFRSNSARAVRNFAQRYNQLSSQFERGFASLEAQATIIEKWSGESRRGAVGTRTDIIREKRAIIGALMNLRRVLFFFERIYFRLNEIRDYMDNAALASEIRRGQTVRQFYEQLDREAPQLMRKMARVRFVAKMYAQRNEGELPMGGFGEEEGGEGEADSFFE